MALFVQLETEASSLRGFRKMEDLIKVFETGLLL